MLQLCMGQLINFWQGFGTVEKQVVSLTPHPYTASQQRGKQWLGSHTTLSRGPRSWCVYPWCRLLVSHSWLVYSWVLRSGGLDPLTKFGPLIPLGETRKPSCRTEEGLYCPAHSPVNSRDFIQISWHLQFLKAPSPGMTKLSEILSFYIL